MTAGGRRVYPALLLVAVTAVWGWTFVVVKHAVAHYPVFSFLGIRFALAAVILWPVVVGLRRRVPRAAVGLGIGAVLAAGYLLQTEGLQRTAVANTGLITGLFVVFTPVLDRLLFRVPTRGTTWLAIGVAFVGTALLTGAAPGGFQVGDLLVLGGSIAFALHIALLSRFSTGDPVGLAAWQMSAAALLLLAGTAVTRSPVVPLPVDVPFALLVTGVFCSAIGFLVQTWVQQRLEATRTAIILTMEPAFTVLFAFLLAGERFDLVQAVGAVLILAALFGNELIERRQVETI